MQLKRFQGVSRSTGRALRDMDTDKVEIRLTRVAEKFSYQGWGKLSSADFREEKGEAEKGHCQLS